jgi:acetylglutamate kinase
VAPARGQRFTLQDTPVGTKRPALTIAAPSLAPADIVLTLVESVGRGSDVEFYLRLFRQLPAHSFAIVVPDGSAINNAQGVVVEQLRFLAHLGLFAPVVLRAFSPSEAGASADGFCAHLSQVGLHSRRYNADEPDLVSSLVRDLNADTIPVVSFGADAPERLVQRFQRIGNWASELGTRKLVIVRSRGGLGPHLNSTLPLSSEHKLQTTERGISLINLRSDYDALLATTALDPSDRELLEVVRSIMLSGGAGGASSPVAAASPSARPLSDNLVTSITTPVNLLRELFTVKGAGTLIKHGSLIETHAGYDTLDLSRLKALLEETFRRPLRDTFFERAPARIYLEEEYRGAAIIERGRCGTYLTKFVVDRLAQGLGVGRDLWETVTRDHPSLYWRSRPDNPIADWYNSQCDGLYRTPRWVVYWRGLGPEAVPALVEDALAQPEDFTPGR